MLSTSKVFAMTLFLCLIPMVGCDQPPKEIPTTRENKGEEKAELPNADLAKKIEDLEKELSILRYKVDALESDSATVSTDEIVYSVARTKFGPFTVVCRDVKPFLDGFKLKLQIGNLTNARFDGAKLHLVWGPPYNESNPSDFFNNRKEKDMEVTNVMSPGAYSTVEVALTPAKPEEIKTITVGLEFNQMALRSP